MLRSLILLFSLSWCPFAALAQDTLLYINGETIIGQVEEIGVDLVRYKTVSSGSTVSIVAEKRELARIRLSGGQEFIFSDAGTDIPETEAFMARKNVIGLDVIAPALDHITVSYERSIGPRTSLVGSVGYIGLWQRDAYGSDHLNSGFLLKLGPKFVLPKATKRYPNARDKHRLAGWYMRPEVLFSYWTERNDRYRRLPPGHGSDFVINKTFLSSAAVNLVLGTQILIGEHFTFDIHGGLGYGLFWQNGQTYDNSNGSGGYRDYSYSHAFFSRTSPLCVSGGLQFGYLF